MKKSNSRIIMLCLLVLALVLSVFNTHRIVSYASSDNKYDNMFFFYFYKANTADFLKSPKNSLPNYFKSTAKLGDYLDKELLRHQKKIVFYSDDASLSKNLYPSYYYKFEQYSIMMTGIRYDMSCDYYPVIYMDPSVWNEYNEKINYQKLVSKESVFKYTIVPKYTHSKKNDRRFFKKLNSVARNAKKKKTTRQRAKYINDYIIKNVSYDNKKDQKNNTAYNAIMKGKTVCGGYSDTFTLIAKLTGIKAETVSGYAWEFYKGRKYNKQYHAWNIVKTGKKWYQLDVTFNDDIGKWKNRYFLLDNKKFKKNHRLDSNPDSLFKSKNWKKSHPLA